MEVLNSDHIFSFCKTKKSTTSETLTMEEEEFTMSKCEVVELPPELPPPPFCPHGPTMIFTKEYNKLVKNAKKRKLHGTGSSLSTSKQSKPFYACAATRDPKFCPFRMDQYRWMTMQPKLREETDIRQRDAINPADEYAYFLNISEKDEEGLETLPKTFAFCHDCCRILISQSELDNMPKEQNRTKHSFDMHLTYRCSKVTTNHPKSFFAEPTKLIRAATDNASQAQYFFADDVPSFVIEEIALKGGFSKVLCIGCPTIHEQILAKYPTSTLSSFLLDIDPRFRQFWPPEQFAQFNMFNYFFFNDTQAVDHLNQFFHANGEIGDTLLVIDPPFGGFIEFIAETIRKLQMLMTNSDIVDHLFFPPMILFWPYFNEHWIAKAFNGEVLITDHVVQYANHTKFGKRNSLPKDSNEVATKHGINVNSPVRVFTNLNRSQIDLSILNKNDQEISDPFYRWCELCNRYVFRFNKHCFTCDECTARDASKRYIHCDVCNICVKNSWFHCENCSHCHLKDSPCT